MNRANVTPDRLEALQKSRKRDRIRELLGNVHTHSRNLVRWAFRHHPSRMMERFRRSEARPTRTLLHLDVKKSVMFSHDR